MHDDFPSLAELKKQAKKPIQEQGLDFEFLINKVKELDLDKIDFENSNYETTVEDIEKARVYFWIRVYLPEEISIEPGDEINFKYVVSGEELTTQFVCYNKKDLKVSKDYNIVGYNSEDDPKVLCIRVDEDKIQNHSDDIPFIRKLFKISRYYEFELFRNTDLILTNVRTGENIKYGAIDF
jgi:hypothetical protein